MKSCYVIIVFYCVYSVINRNKPNIVFNKVFFGIISGFNIISSESGKVLCNNAIYSAYFGIVNHSFEIRSVKS